MVLISLSFLNPLLFYLRQIPFISMHQLKPVSYLLFNWNRIVKCYNNIFTQHIHACTYKICYENTTVITYVLCFSTIGWKNYCFRSVCYYSQHSFVQVAYFLKPRFELIIFTFSIVFVFKNATNQYCRIYFNTFHQ